MKKMNKWVSLFAMMGAMMASESKGKDNVDVMSEVFGQERVAMTEIDGVTVSLTKGERSITNTVPNMVEMPDGGMIQYGTKEVVSYYPILREANGQGVANGYTDMPKFADIAINKDRKEIWASAEGNTNTLFRISLKGISTNNMFGSSMAIQPELLRNNNSDDAGIAETKADKLITFGSWILTFNNAEPVDETMPVLNTKIFHINKNGSINAQEQPFSTIVPITYTETADALYMTDGSQTVALDKNNPTAGVSNVVTTATSGIVGLAALNGTLYQATSAKIYNGSEGVLSEPVVKDGKIKYDEVDLIKINSLATYGESLIVSYNAEADVVVSDLLLNKNVPVIAIQGASKVFATQNGIQALVNNKLVRVR